MTKTILNGNGTFSRVAMTPEECEAEYLKALDECYRKRKAEYPKVADYLDAQAKGNTESMGEWTEAQLNVKIKYPKPNRADYGLGS